MNLRKRPIADTSIERIIRLMVEHDPVSFDAEPSDIDALRSDILGIYKRSLAGTDRIDQVQLGRSVGLITIDPTATYVGHCFEAFSLSINSSRAIVKTTAPDWEPWPFDEWEVFSLVRRDWLANDLASDFMSSGATLKPGEVPAGTMQACEVAVGLLFKGVNDNRLLIAAADQPAVTLFVTSAAPEIDSYIANCFLVHGSEASSGNGG